MKDPSVTLLAAFMDVYNNGMYGMKTLSSLFRHVIRSFKVLS